MTRSEIMYVEEKAGLTGDARIGLVRRSKTGRTLYYDGRSLQSLKGDGYKANYFDTETRERFWVSRPRRDGQDTLYPGVVEIDENVRATYWTELRHLPDSVSLDRYRSEGKHSRRRPQPEKPNHKASGRGRSK